MAICNGLLASDPLASTSSATHMDFRAATGLASALRRRNRIFAVFFAMTIF